MPLKPEHLDVVEARHGRREQGRHRRARLRRARRYTSAGKTGTAQVIAIKQGEKYDESRVSPSATATTRCSSPIAPADNPKIALAVIVENGGFGARAAAPIARQVFDYYLLGKQPRLQSQRRKTRTTTKGAATDGA